MLKFLLDLWRDESGGDAGRLGLGLLGAGIGFLIGGPFGAASFGASLGFLGGSIVGNILFPQELPDIEGARLDTNRVMTSSYGDPIPVAFGTVMCKGIVAYFSGAKEHIIEEEVGGGKGGSPTQTQRTYTYTGDLRVNFCEGPADSILQLYANRKLFYDITNSGNPIVDWAKFQEPPGHQALRIYLGTETQQPDPTEQAAKGVGATPAYRGITGVFLQGYGLDESGGVPPQITAVMAMKSTETLSATTHPKSATAGSAWIWQEGRNSFVMGGAAIWDNTSQAVTAANLSVNDGTLMPIVDRNGDVWGLSSGRFFARYDAKTLIQLSVVQLTDPETGGGFGDDSLDWEDGIAFGGTRLTDGTYIGEKLIIFQQWFGGSQKVLFASLDGSGSARRIWTQVEEASDSLIVDNERFAWFTATVGGVSRVQRISPGTGLVDLFYDLDAVYTKMSYDKVTNSLIMFGSTRMIRFSLDTGTETGRFVWSGSSPAGGGKNLSIFRQGPTFDGRMYIQTGATLGGVTEFNVQGVMSQGRSFSMAGDFGLPSSTTHRGFFDESRNAIIKLKDISGELFYLYIDRHVGDAITVKSIVDAISLRVGMLVADFDASELVDTLHGYILDTRVTARAALEPLRRFFFFNPIEEDWKIKFPKLGSSSVATIPEEDLGAGEEDPQQSNVRFAEEIIQEMELPELLELSYANKEAEYQVQVQRAVRPRSTTNTKRAQSLSFPGTFISNAQAAQKLEILLYSIWTKRRPVNFKVSQRWLALSPGDVVDVVSEGVSHQVILGRIDSGANNVLEMAGAADDPTLLTSVATGSEGSQPAQTIPYTGPSEFFLMDISPLRSIDGNFGIYAGGGPFTTAVFLGEDILRGSDGENYSPFTFIPSARPVEHGFATAALPSHEDAGLWDRTNSFIITMLSGTLPSQTEATTLDGAGALLIGKEIVCYAASVDNGNRTYTVSTLLRGRGGTESEMGAHVEGETVVVLDETKLVRKVLDISDLGVPFFYKGVTLGGSLINAVRKQLTIEGRSLWKFGSAHVWGSITSNDWNFSWKWRSSTNGLWRNLSGQAHEGNLNYSIDVLSGPGGSILATYTTTATANGSVINASAHTFFYDDADQTVDFGAPQTTITIKIYRLDTDVGRGWATEKTLVGA